MKPIDNRFLLLKRSLQLKTPEARQEYTRYRNKLTHTIKTAKINHHGNEFDGIRGDTRKIWKKINKMKNNNQKRKSSLPEKLVVNGVEINDKHDIANHLNKHFVEKGPNLASKLPRTESSIYKTLGQRNPYSMVFNDSTIPEVVGIVDKFDINKMFGIDNIPAILIKWAIHIIAPFFV